MIAAPRYTRDHEYIRVIGGTQGAVGIGAQAVVGIGAYAVEALGGVVAVTLPATGQVVRAGDSVAAFESAKAVCEVFTPATGTIVAVNTRLLEHPAIVNDDPTGAGWFFRLELADPAELTRLFDEAAYGRYLQSLLPGDG